MQIIDQVVSKTQEFVQENATTLLTAGGVVGVVTTGVLAFRGGYKASEKVGDMVTARMLIAEREGEEVEPITQTERFKIAAPHVISPVVTGGLTIAAIIMANRMNAQKAAALAAAYGLSQKQLDEYKAKVAEKLGVKKEQAIQDDLAQERVNNTPQTTQILIADGEVLCFDQATGRYFRSSMEQINQAVNAVNAEIINHDYATASMFYDELGLPGTTWSRDVGWNNNRRCELSISTVMRQEDQKPCIAIDFVHLPTSDYILGGYD